MVEQFACPRCRYPWAKTALERRRSLPVSVDLECNGACRPKRTARAPLPEDLERIAAIEARPIPDWAPETPFDDEREMWRGGHRDAGITRACDFWTRRNLAALAAAWAAIEREPAAGNVQGALRFAFTATLFRVSRMRRYLAGGSGVVSGTLYIPSLSLEVHMLKLLRKKVGDFLAAKAALALAPGPSALIPSPSPNPGRREQITAARCDVIVRTGSATLLAGVPDGSIDYVFTDPPFGSNIFYADCSFPWEAWLGRFADESQEAVWNKSRKPEQGGKSLDDYARLMQASFREMQRVLKPGRWASVVFHNSDDRVWDAIRDGAEAAGLTLVNARALDKEQRSFKGVKGEKGEERVTNFDIVLNLRKGTGNRPARAEGSGEQGTVGRGALHAPGGTDTASPAAAPPATAGSLPLAGGVHPIESGPGQSGAQPPGAFKSANAAETDARVAAIIAEHLAALSGSLLPGLGEGLGMRATPAAEQRSTQFLHSLVIRRLLSDGAPVTDVDYARVESVARVYFKQVDGRWYGLGEEVAPLQSALPGFAGPALRLSDEASAIAWVRELLRANGPQPWGDLINALQRAAAGLRLRPEELLSQNFVLDQRRNRWRLPTMAELAQLGDVQQRLLKERVERWLAGGGRHPRDGAEKAAWFERLFDYGLHALAYGVFQRTYADEVDAATWNRMRRRARVSALKAGAPPRQQGPGEGT